MALVQVELVGVVDQADDLQVGGHRVEFRRDRSRPPEDAGAVLAGGFGDELLDPVRQTLDVRAVGDQTELVASRVRCGDRCAEAERGFSAESTATSSEDASASFSSSSMSTPARPKAPGRKR